MLVFMANNDANSANLGLHGLQSHCYNAGDRQWKMVKSQNQNVHIWNPIVDTFMIFYLKVCVSIIICHEDPQMTWKQLILVCFWQC